MSLTKKFLPSPRLDTHDEPPLADGKNYRGGVRGKRLWFGVTFVCVLYLIVICNLVTLIILASFLRLDSRGSYYFSFGADNLLRVHSSLLTHRVLLDGSVTSDPPLSINSLSEVRLRGGTLLSDQAGIISQPSLLLVTRNSTSASDLVLRTKLGSQLELLAGAVRLAAPLRAREIAASSAIQAAAILTRNRSLLIRGDSANTLLGARGASLATQTLLISADNGSLSLQAPTINISAYASVLLSGGQLIGSDGSVRYPQLRLCACKDGALFLLSHASNNCRLRGPAGNLC